MRKIFLLACLALAAAPPGMLGSALAQPAERPKLGLSLGNLPGLDPASLSPDDVQLSARFELDTGKRQGRLFITAEISPGAHIYSLTQPKGGPLKSVLTPKAGGEYQLTGQFSSTPAPHVVMRPEFKVPSEEHEDTVTWQAPIALAEGVDPGKLVIEGTYNGLVCAEGGACVPLNKIGWKARFAGYVGPAAAPAAESANQSPAASEPKAPPASTLDREIPVLAATYRLKDTHAGLGGRLLNATVAAGGTLELVLAAEPDAGYHVYAYKRSYKKVIGGGEPTLVIVREPAGWGIREVFASSEPKVFPATEALPERREHEHGVRWLVRIAVPANAAPGEYRLQGNLGLQTCTESQCDRPEAADFSVPVKVVAAGSTIGEAAAAEVAFTPGNYIEVSRLAMEPAAAAGEPAKADSQPQGSEKGAGTALPLVPPHKGEPGAAVGDKNPQALWSVLLLAFVGGLILNVMPCVLPVVGLKIHSFVKQAGYAWGRNFLLNLSYSAGLIFVFLVLGALAVFAGLAWGQQFSTAEFNIVLTALLFTMALSLLGVWEIPLPGFGGASSKNKHEGLGGAFVTGVISTVLATPCSGPFLGAVLGWAVSQSAGIALLVFFVMGLGMASPFLLIGFAPRLVSFLPKPGEWMDAFKQVMGFILLATVVYLLSVVGWANVLPTVGLLTFLGVACWWIGRVPVYAEFSAKFKAWLVGTVVTALGAWLMFGWLGGVMHDRFLMAVDREIARRGELANSDEAILIELQTERARKLHDDPHSLPELAFTPRRFQVLRDSRRTIFLDFTADWCLSCQVNKAVALHKPLVREHVEKHEVYVLVADLSPDVPFRDEMNVLLEQLGSKSIPFYAFYPPNDGPPEILRDVVTEGQVLSALQRVTAGSAKMAMRP